MIKYNKQHKAMETEVGSIDFSCFNFFLSLLVDNFDQSSFQVEVTAENARQGFQEKGSDSLKYIYYRAVGRIFSSEGFVLDKFQWILYETIYLIFYVVSNVSCELLLV